MCAVTRLEDDNEDKHTHTHTHCITITKQAHQKSNMHVYMFAAQCTHTVAHNVLKVVQYIIHINRWALNCCSLVILCHLLVFLLLIFECIVHIRPYHRVHFANVCVSFAVCLVNYVFILFENEQWLREKHEKKLSTLYDNAKPILEAN